MLTKIQSFVLLLTLSLCSIVSAETYKVPATKDTVTLGLFTLKKPPVIKVHSGDSVSMETWNSCLKELDNNTLYPDKTNSSKMAVQWATTAEATQKANISMMSQSKLDVTELIMISKQGKIQLTSPEHRQYFRVLVWSTNKEQPDQLTNWVSIIPNKVYTLNQEQLIPALLISGSGC